MTKFYSSLIISSKSFANVHRVFKPRYNKVFFKRVMANVEQLESHIDKRCRDPDTRLSNEHLNTLKRDASQLVKLKDRIDKLAEDDSKHQEVLSQIETIEDKIMPTVIKIPNRLSKAVPEEDRVIEEVKSDFMEKQKLSKVLSHRKLSYINNCYSKSVVGPNSHYYFGIGAKLQNAISDYFTSELEALEFVPVSGPSLVKSAVVEAVNSSDNKEYFNDPARILTDDHKYTTLHLTEASRESLAAFITTIGPIPSDDPLRLMTAGAGYRLGSDWFDGDDKRITQFETLHALVLNSSIEQYSIKEYQFLTDAIWSSYKKLELPTRLVHCSPESMRLNEYDSHRIDIWLPSRHNWFQVGRISHYLDYLTVRLGMRRGHFIDSMVFDGQILAAAIIENKQTAFGKFIIPDAIGEHTLQLNEEEAKQYLDNSAEQRTDSGTMAREASSITPRAGVLNNHEQRRYLKKVNHPFGHSRKASELAKMYDANRNLRIFMALATFGALMIDWEDFWIDYMPDWLRFILYDFVYRPARRIWWLIIYEKGHAPPDLSYFEIDKKDYEKDMFKRRKELVMAERFPPWTRNESQEVIEATKVQETNQATAPVVQANK